METRCNTFPAFYDDLQPRKSSPLAKPVSNLLLFYLQTSSDKLLTRCYPEVKFKLSRIEMESIVMLFRFDIVLDQFSV